MLQRDRVVSVCVFFEPSCWAGGGLLQSLDNPDTFFRPCGVCFFEPSCWAGGRPPSHCRDRAVSVCVIFHFF